MRSGLALTGYEAVRFGTGAVTGRGRLVLVTGRVTGFDLTVSVPKVGQVPITSINSIAYARLPRPTKRGTIYTVLSAGSAHASVRRSARSVADLTTSVQPAALLSMVTAAAHLTSRGRGTVGAVPVLRYRMAVRVARLTDGDPLRALLRADGASRVTVDVSVDGRGRPVRARYVGSGTGTVTATYTEFNRPFPLSPPPQDEVDTGG